MKRKKESPRSWTLSVALPASILDNIQSFELKAYFVGQIARCLTLYGVDFVVIYEDKLDSKRVEGKPELSRAARFFMNNLSYLETPQYLRKILFNQHEDLQKIGLLHPLDAVHHLREDMESRYRDGVSVAGPPVKGSWIACGLAKKLEVPEKIPAGQRVTLKIRKKKVGPPQVTTVDSREPVTSGHYQSWGYSVGHAPSLAAVLKPDVPYDLVIGTSERGEVYDQLEVPPFSRALLVFGNREGLEAVVRDPQSGLDASHAEHSHLLYDKWVNTVPQQGSRSVRLEEAVLVSLAVLSPLLRQH